MRALLDRFPPETIVYPGHGPPTTLGAELATNPFLAELRTDGAQFQAPRGTHDVLPADAAALAERSSGRWRSCRALYGYRRIQTPVFEDTELFARTSGAAPTSCTRRCTPSTDRSDRSLTLRPEGTAPICRAYVEHGMHREPQPVKAVHDRADVSLRARRRRGRYREH